MSVCSTSAGPRERILETAARLFFRQGCRATGINQIIAESQVAKASFYGYFSSKERLILAWLDQREAMWIAELRRRLIQADTIRQRTSMLFSMWRTQIETEGFRGCGFSNTAGEFADEGSPIRLRVREHKSRVRQVVADEVLAGCRPAQSPERFAALVDGVYCLFDSAITQAQNLMEEWPIQASEMTAQYLVGQYLAEAS